MNQFNHPPNPMTLWLSLVTVPLIGSLLVAHRIGEELIAMGQNSEEIFRGDRLPILNFPESSEEEEGNIND